MVQYSRAPGRRRRGQGLVELALILPILLLVLMGIIDFGWMIFNYSQLFNSLREALRYGTVTGYGTTPQYLQCAEIRRRITELAASSGVKAADIEIVYDDGRPISDYTTAKVAYCDGDVFTQEATYTPYGYSAPIPRGYIVAGDRLVITINVQVPFLTPLVQAFVPAGIPMRLHAARTIFPEGLGL